MRIPIGWALTALLAASVAFAQMPLHFEPSRDGAGYVVQTGDPSILITADRVAFRGMEMRLLGARPGASSSATDTLPGRSNYFIGADAARWRTSVAHFGKVRYTGVYPGVDLVYHGNEGHLEYDFVLAPHADPRVLKIAFSEKVRIDSEGNLIAGSLRFNKPIAYQGNKQIAVQYAVHHRQVTFHLGPYDPAQTLLIDPTLVYSTLFSGSAFYDSTQANAVAVDSAGNTYITGQTTATDLPVLNAFQQLCSRALSGSSDPCNDGDVFIAKFSPAGALLYSTYLGGSDFDTGLAIAVDSTGAAYVTGYTQSKDFPLKNPLQATKPSTAAGERSVFVTKLSADGSALFYSTYLGGSGGYGDEGHGIAVDSAGNAYVVGLTASPNFPLVNALKTSIVANDEDAFVSKFNPAGSALLFSTYLGGSGPDFANAVALDSAGNIYVTGQAFGGLGFPNVNAAQTQETGRHAFVTKYSAANQIVYSTFVGGSGIDQANGIAVDSSGAAYITGVTASKDFPTVNAIQPTLQSTSPGSSNAFVTKLNPSGSSFVYSTYLGGSLGEAGFAIAVDAAGEAYVAGGTGSPDFPLSNALEATPAAAFLSKLSADGSRFIYSTYFGGAATLSGVVGSGALAVDGSGQAYIAGRAVLLPGVSFPTINGYQPTSKGSGGGAFLAKISETATPPCAYSLLANATSFPEAGATGLMTVTANGSTCSWQATLSSSWLTATPTTSVTGIGQVQFTVAANTTPVARTATITAGAQVVTISQDAASHVVTAPSAGIAGGIARVPVTLASDLTANYIALSFSLSVPGIGTTLGFQVDPSLPPPQISTSGGPGTITVSWTDLVQTTTTGSVKLGELLVSIPAAATAGQTYTVQSLGGSGTYRPPNPNIPTTETLVAGVNVLVSVASPVPLAELLVPSSAAPGSAGLTVTVMGEGFTPTSTVLWNGAPRATTFKSETQLQAAITTADLAAAGTAQISVSNPAPGGGQSAMLPFSITTSAAPAINASGVVNAGSYSLQLAPGDLAAIFGVNLASGTTVASSIPLPVMLGGVSVLVNGVAAPLIYVSPQQINFQVPYLLQPASGSANVVVSVNGLSSNAIPITTVSAAPALLTVDGSGHGQGVIIAGTTLAAAAGSIPGVVSKPASVGTTVVIYCIGLGAVNADLPDGAAAPFPGPTTIAGTVTATIGGVAVTSIGGFITANFVGLYQVNAQIPPGVASSAAVPVTITVNGVASNTVTMAVQ
jgi:uncharacterized protein (TIGR03437 family)